MRDAKKQGKVRFIGFTGHKTPQIHLRMMALADQHGLHFDTVQMPLNPFDATYRSFQQYVLPEALRRGMGVIGMKSMGGSGEPIQQGALTAQEALRYAMSLPASVTVSGIDSLQVLRQNLEVAKDFQPMTPERDAGPRPALPGPRRRRPPGDVQKHPQIRRQSRPLSAQPALPARIAHVTSTQTERANP